MSELQQQLESCVREKEAAIDELRRKERELSETHQQLRQKVKIVIQVSWFVTRGPPDCRRNSCDQARL